jgi:hypothetical protein
MRSITLHVPDGRCTDEWWTRCTEQAVADMIESIGCLFGLNGDASEQIKQLQQRLEGASDAANVAARAATLQIEGVWRDRINEKDTMIRTMQEQCATMKCMVDQTRQACETQQRNTEAIVKSLQANTSIITTPQQRGEMAEEEVEHVIVETIACEVEDVSHKPGCGDRFISTPDGLKLMMEVKNVERLHSKHDMDKFRNDVHNGVKSQRINAAMMISLRTTSIPNVSGSCSVTFLQGDNGRVPVLILSSGSKTAIQLAVHAVAQLQIVAEKESKARGGGSIPIQLETLEKERQVLQKHLPCILKHIHENDTAVESRIEMLQRLLDEANSDRTRQKEIMFQLMKLQQNIRWIGVSEEANDIELAVSIVLKWYERKQEFPKTSEMTMPQRAAIKNAGGLKMVTDMARKRQREGDTSEMPEEVRQS